jgi:hypothetical protein
VNKSGGGKRVWETRLEDIRARRFGVHSSHRLRFHEYDEWSKDGAPIYISGGGGAPLIDPKNGRHHFLEVTVRKDKATVVMHPLPDNTLTSGAKTK